ncbi:MAG: hypothetical protein ACK4ND_17640 [Cytophagaceae bacterium]
MKNLYTIYIFLFLVLTMTSCEIIADIFAAGIWVGVIGVLLIVGLILFIISKLRG